MCVRPSRPNELGVAPGPAPPGASSLALQHIRPAIPSGFTLGLFSAIMPSPWLPNTYPTPLSGGDSKTLQKELTKARAMTGILSERAAEKRRIGAALMREADVLACQSWNERMWSNVGPVDPSPTIDQAISGGYPWLENPLLSVQDAP